MLSEAEICGLYHNLLGRAPEGLDTIYAFQNYYETLESGRRAILLSTEFANFFARQTGQILNLEHNLAASLSLFFMNRQQQVKELPTENVALCSKMQNFYSNRDKSYLAIAIGHAAYDSLGDLIPLGGHGSAILHIAPEFPLSRPSVVQTLDGTTIFQLGSDASAVASILVAIGRPLNAVYLLDSSAIPKWIDMLRRHFADVAVIVVGQDQSDFDAGPVHREITERHHCETLVSVDGLRISQVGGWLLPVAYQEPTRPYLTPLKENYPSLAIASIVRNEERSLANMLRSTLGLASYYAILDTGSTDRTLDVARSFLSASGAPHWLAQRDRADFDNSFSVMRNAVLGQIPSWVSWVLMLDADEEVVPEDFEPLLRLARDTMTNGPLCFALPRYNFATPDKSGIVLGYPDIQIRLLRNTDDRRVFYTGRIHETVKSVPFGTVPLDAFSVGGPRGGPHIHHLVRRFRTSEEEADKQAFYNSLSEQRL